MTMNGKVHGMTSVAGKRETTLNLLRTVLMAVLLSQFLLVSCGKGKVSKADKPEQAAISYVNNLAAEHYDDCLSMMASLDNASDSYKATMKAMLKQMVREKKAGGFELKQAECLHVDLNGAATTAKVYLRLSYTNDSTETMLLPLIKDGRAWRLR